MIYDYMKPKDKMDAVLHELSLRFNDEDQDYYYYDCDTCGYNGFTINCGNYGDYCYKCYPLSYTQEYFDKIFN